jgi:hypothetical protein
MGGRHIFPAARAGLNAAGPARRRTVARRTITLASGPIAPDGGAAVSRWIANIARNDVAACAALVAAGVGILYLRDPHSLLLPTLYTEDGLWMASLFNRGLVTTLIHAKGGETPYFVALNILLLQSAKSLNELVFNASLARLPHFVSGLSMLFYAVLAAAPAWLLRPFLGRPARALLWMLVILMPLGDSSFEVLGRISNIGFGVLFLCFCLLANRRVAAAAASWGRVAVLDAGVFLCATTNPLCYPVIAADYAARAWAMWRCGAPPAHAVRAAFAPRSGLVLAIALGAAIGGMALLESRPSPFLRDQLRWNEVVEATVARPLLFPFLFPVYGRLSDPLALGLAAGLGRLGWWLTGRSPPARRLFVAAGAVAAFAAVATLAMRPGLTHVLNAYSTSLLDRYYYGTSLFAVLAACAAMSAGLQAADRPRRLTAAAGVVLVVAVYAGSIGLLVEWGRPRWRELPERDFASVLAAAHEATVAAQPDAQKVRIDLHPPPWKARFPAENARATAIAIAPDTLRR